MFIGDKNGEKLVAINKNKDMFTYACDNFGEYIKHKKEIVTAKIT